MDTQSDTAKYAAIGLRFRGAYLVQQAGYTLGIAALEGTATRLLDSGDDEINIFED